MDWMWIFRFRFRVKLTFWSSLLDICSFTPLTPCRTPGRSVSAGGPGWRDQLQGQARLHSPPCRSFQWTDYCGETPALPGGGGQATTNTSHSTTHRVHPAKAEQRRQIHHNGPFFSLFFFPTNRRTTPTPLGTRRCTWPASMARTPPSVSWLTAALMSASPTTRASPRCTSLPPPLRGRRVWSCWSAMGRTLTCRYHWFPGIYIFGFSMNIEWKSVSILQYFTFMPLFLTNHITIAALFVIM